MNATALVYLRRHAFGVRIAIDAVALTAATASFLCIENQTLSAILLGVFILGGEAVSQAVYHYFKK